MSRFTIALIAVLIIIIGGVILLSTINTEVPPTRVEKAMANETAQ